MIVLPLEKIEDIKEEFGSKEIISDEELENFQKIRESTISNAINLSKLFLRCYDILNNNINILEESKELKIGLSNYLKNMKEIENLRRMIADLDNFGSYYIELDIKDIVEKEGGEYRDLINLFFTIFGDTL